MAPPVLYYYQKGEIKMVDEKIMQKLMQMLHERRDWYDAQAMLQSDENRAQYEWASMAYDSCCWMLDFAYHLEVSSKPPPPNPPEF